VITTQPANRTVSVGETAAFSVVATGSPAPTYQWRRGGTNITGATSASYTTPATVIGDNGAVFSVVATNSAGTVTSANATLTVTAANTPPTVTLTSPAANAVIAPGTVNLAATASDAGGSVTKVEFYNGSTKLGEDLTSPYTYAWTSVPAGTYPLMAKAIDNLGAETSTAYIQITVGTNAAPTAAFSISNAPNSRVIAFDGTISSDPDGDLIAAYAWTFTNVASGQPTASTAAKPTITFNATATSFVATLRVTDSRNAQSTVLSRTYNFSDLIGGTTPPPQESNDKKIIYVGETTSFNVDLSNDKAILANWTSSGNGQVLFYNSSGEPCNAWTATLANNGGGSAFCSDCAVVKGTKPGKVTVSVVTTPHASERTCGSGGSSGGGSSVSKTFQVTVLPRSEPPPKMPLGSKFRRVDVHGIPMPDPSPTGEGESDRVPNMAYTDMFGLTPTYATTDVGVPVDGGELTLEFRRTMSISSRNYHPDPTRLGVTYPSDDLLGLGWSTNLGSRVVITERKDKSGVTYLVADVTDEVGGSYGYQISGSGTGMVFRADLAHSFNNEAIKAKLTVNASSELVLTKPHGTKVTYQQIPRLFYAPFSSAGDSCGGAADIHKEIYYRVKSITDRNNNRLDFTYNLHRAVTYQVVGGQNQPVPAPAGEGPNGDLVVKKITFVNNGMPADTKRVLTINASWHTEFAENAWMQISTGRDSGWRIDSVVDPLGRVTTYHYRNYTELAPPNDTFALSTNPWVGAPLQGIPGVLIRVDRPSVSDFTESTGSGVNDSATTRTPSVAFAYHIKDLRDSLLDPANPPAMNGQVGINRYIAPKAITDARGHVTTMTYRADWFPVNYYPALGSFVWQERIRLLTMGTAADGTATFAMAAFPNAYVINPGANSIDLTTEVTDVRGVKTTCIFSQKIALVPNEVGAALYATRFERITAGAAGNGNTGKTVFEWSDPFGLPDPNGNLTRVTDMSGNVIQFVYRSGVAGDTYDQGMTNATGALNGYYNPNRYMAFNKPAKRIVDPTGLNLVTEYRYESLFNKEKEQIDAEGKRTVYVFDTKGNRTQVQEAVGTTVARSTVYAYAANGFVTQVTDPDLRITTHAQTFTTTTTVPVPAGMVDTAGETVPLEQAYQQVVSTVKGYANELSLATTSVSDVMGNPRWSIDPRGNAMRSYYDALNRSVKVKQPAVVNSVGTTVTSISETFYDLNGNVRKQTDDEGNATISTYDLMNRATKVRVRMTNPLANDDVLDLVTQTNYRHGSDASTTSVGLPRFTIDANGNRTDYVYDNLLRLTTTTFPTVTLPDTTTVRYTMVNTYGVNSGSGAFAYWSGWQPVRVKDKRGYVTDSTFDKIYRPTRVVQRASLTPPTDPASAPAAGEPTTETFYTKTHKPVRQVTWSENWAGSVSNQTTWLSYDSLYRTTVTVTDANNGNGTVTAVTAPPAFVEDGLAYSDANANALVSATSYNKAGSPVTVKDALGRQTTNTYDGAGRLTQVVQPSVTVIDPKGYNANNTAITPTTKYTYDAAGNRTLVEDANHTKTQTTYDARNRITQVVVDLNNDGVYSAAFNGADLVSTTRYNLVGKPVLITDSRSNATDHVYDRAYRQLVVKQPSVTNAQNGTATRPEITRTYDKNGNLLTIQDARQKVHAAAVKTVNTYDQLNRLRTATEASGASATTETLKNETRYDANGNVLAVLCFNSAASGGTQTTSYTYDAFNRRLTETLPTVADAQLRQTTWTYYRAGAVRTRTDALGQIHESEYDRAARLAKSRHKLNASTTDETRVFTLSKTGKPLTVSDKTGSTTNVYDAFDQVVSETRTTTGQTAYTVQNAYDAIGQRTRVIYPATNRTTLNHFDRGGRLVTVNDGTKNTVYTHDANGNRLTITEPNGVVTTNTYDALNRCLTSFTRKSGTTVSDFTYAYDLVGNRLQVIENLASQGSRTITYTYDARYQLLSEAWATPTTFSNTYEYDLAGNRTKLTNVNGATTTVTTATYDVLNRLLSSTKSGVGTTYTYDLNGNQKTQVTGGTTHTFTWDVHNRLLNVTQGTGSAVSLAATYDYRTRRETTAVNGAAVRFFRYDQGVSFHELIAGALQVEFLRGPDMGGGIGSILYSDRTMAGGIEETFAYNPAVGHVTALTNSTGAAVDSDRFDAFGNIVGAAFGSSLNNRLANTKERTVIGSLALDNHGFRYYNPVTGRYLNRDPLGYADGMNPYLYVHNNPINSIDPLGLWDWGWKALRVIGNVSSGIADAVTFGAVGKAQDAMGVSGSVDRTGVAYRVGGVAGDVMVTAATGGAGGGLRAVAKATVEVAKGEVKAMMIDGATQAAAATGLVSQETAEKIAQGAQLAHDASKAGKNAKAAQGEVGVAKGVQPEGKGSASRLSDRATKELPPGERRTPEENKQARNHFKNNKDEAKRQYEERTGEEWPSNATHAEHPRPLKEGGDPLHVEPGFDGPTSPHMKVGEDGLTDFQRWGREGGQKAAENRKER
jgi:RHS repeat-associated protein